MKEQITNVLKCAFVLVFVVLSSCNQTADGELGFVPTRIVASWTGGAAGLPNDRTDTEATDYTGPMCPASGIRFMNQTDGAVLTLINDCPSLVTLYVCQTKGGLPQPDLGLDECADDPLLTPFSQFKIHPITPLLGGGAEDYRNATAILSINAFYCSSTTTLSTLTGTLLCI